MKHRYSKCNKYYGLIVLYGMFGIVLYAAPQEFAASDRVSDTARDKPLFIITHDGNHVQVPAGHTVVCLPPPTYVTNAASAMSDLQNKNALDSAAISSMTGPTTTLSNQFTQHTELMQKTAQHVLHVCAERAREVKAGMLASWGKLCVGRSWPVLLSHD